MRLSKKLQEDWLKMVELTVTATEHDQELAAAKDFVEIKGDKAFWKNKWDAAGKEVVWDMVHYDTQFIGWGLHFTVVESPKWQLVKVKL